MDPCISEVDAKPHRPRRSKEMLGKERFFCIDLSTAGVDDRIGESET
jgi:hypothetical protein